MQVRRMAHGVHHPGTAGAACRIVRPEHEVVDDQLRASLKEVRQHARFFFAPDVGKLFLPFGFEAYLGFSAHVVDFPFTLWGSE